MWPVFFLLMNFIWVSDMDKVVYVDVPGWPKYMAGSDGSILSLKGKLPRILKQTKRKKSEYSCVSLVNGRFKRSMNIHWVVLLAFCGPKPAGMVRRHIDGNPRNNSISNLAYGTHKKNSLDAIMHGTTLSGEKNKQSKYSESDIEKVRNLYFVDGLRQKEICKITGMKKCQVSGIVLGRSWKHSCGGRKAERSTSPNKKIFPGDEEKIIEMKFSEGLTQKKIAKIMSVSESLISSLIQKHKRKAACRE